MIGEGHIETQNAKRRIESERHDELSELTMMIMMMVTFACDE